MTTSKDSPCRTCAYKRANDCEVKNCPRWRAWFVKAWETLRQPYLKYLKKEETR